MARMQEPAGKQGPGLFVVSAIHIMSSALSCPALLIGAPASDQGKTTLTAALERWHRRQGRRVRVFKCRPDVLDPTVLTGHQAPAERVALADTVTEMALVKHPFKAGVPAQRGIED